MPKIYTKTGDAGETALYGRRVSKTDPTIGLLGKIDSFSVKLGFLLHYSAERSDRITEIQQFLIELGSVVAGYPTKEHAATQLIKLLECDIDEMNESLPKLKNFILPQGNLPVLYAHKARVACRKMESKLLKVLAPSPMTTVVNRLSDWLFMLARSLSEKELAYQREKGLFVV